MSGGDSWDQRGIVPRVFCRLFEEIRERIHNDPVITEYKVYVSYFEIYNEHGYDLLDRKHAETPFDKWNKINLYEDSGQNLHLKNLTIHQCTCEQDAIDLLMMGNFIRQVSATPMNPASSRSHCIFTIAIEGKGNEVLRMSKLHLVDLAGSERVYKKNLEVHDQQVTTEARYINRSLSYLEQVIIALHEKAKGTRVHVPYRNSMMTSILRDSLGGNCRTVMVANVSPDLENEEETLSTARFAQRCAKLVNEMRVNEVLDVNLILQKLSSENQQLKMTVQKQEEVIKLQMHTLHSQSLSPSPLRHQNPLSSQPFFHHQNSTSSINSSTIMNGSYQQQDQGDFPQQQQEEPQYYMVGADPTAPSSGRYTQGSTTRLRVQQEGGYQQVLSQLDDSQGNIPAIVNELDMSEIAECERCARMYIEKDDFEIEIANVAQITEYFRIFKTFIKQREQIHQKEVTFLQSQIQTLKSYVENRYQKIPQFAREIQYQDENVRSSHQLSEHIPVQRRLDDQLKQIIQESSSAITQKNSHREHFMQQENHQDSIIDDSLNQTPPECQKQQQFSIRSSPSVQDAVVINVDLENKISDLIKSRKEALLKGQREALKASIDSRHVPSNTSSAVLRESSSSNRYSQHQ
ncbi:hypothetical protein FGO68_gene10349 [Halteria grandinella]|uniref:Kinesin-like protein n=1 Tax=Halteria grandinella TaxID=5974 RepID=A0A8J8T5J1_HALGN|nr:hypothetical protein FGO68_gene10349 [Halteria grandinella]